jgi:hypothetical protein
LKRQIADNLRRKRQGDASFHPNQVVSYDSHYVSSNDNDEIVDHKVLGTIGILTTDTHTNEQLSLSTESPSVVPERLTSYREAELIMHYMDAVFPLQFRFYIPEARGRGWLLWLLVQSRPLYHAALSLSALHQSIYMPIQFKSSYAELAGYHA